jgi:tetratricopeptide (TPR) repeat protein
MEFLFEQIVRFICIFILECVAFAMIISPDEIYDAPNHGIDFNTATSSYFTKIALFAFTISYGIIIWRLPNQRFKYCSRKGIKAFKSKEYILALEWFLKSAESNPDDKNNHFNIACAYCQIQDIDNTIVYLEKALAKGYRYEKVKNDPDLAWLRSQIDIDKQFTPYAANTDRGKEIQKEVIAQRKQ